MREYYAFLSYVLPVNTYRLPRFGIFCICHWCVCNVFVLYSWRVNRWILWSLCSVHIHY